MDAEKNIIKTISLHGKTDAAFCAIPCIELTKPVFGYIYIMKNYTEGRNVRRNIA